MQASVQQTSPCGQRRQEAPAPTWLDHLPADWRDMVVAPIHFTRHRDYEIAAARLFGRDEYGLQCYYEHDYALTETRSDDDEDYYQVVTHSETVRAWRLRDERWLIYRHVQHGEHCAAGRGFYSFADRPPR